MKKDHNHQDLSHIYQKKGKTIDVTHFNKPYGAKRLLGWARFLSFIIIFLTFVSIAWLHNDKTPKLNSDLLFLNIKGDKSVIVQEPITYTFFYENKNQAALHKPNLELNIPDSFILTHINNKAYSLPLIPLKLPTLEPQKSNSLTITGYYISEPDSEQVLSATLIPTQSPGINSSIQTRIKPLDIDIKITQPETIVFEEELEYKITVLNNSDKQIENLTILATYPSNFKENTSSFAKKENNDGFETIFNEWIIPILEPQKKQEIIILGEFQNSENPENDFAVKTAFLNPKTNNYSIQSNTTKHITTESEKELQITTIVNGSTDPKPIKLGDALRYSINIKNPTQYTYQNISLTLETEDNGLIDWEKIEDIPYSNEGNKHILTLSKDIFNELAELKPDKEYTTDLNLPIKSEKTDKINAQVNQTATLETTQLFEENSVEIKKEINKTTYSLLSDTDIIAYARYYNNDIKVGSGPVPPRVGKETTYVVYLEIENNINEIKDITYTLALPENIKWKGSESQEAGDLSFNSNKNEVTWDINRIPKQFGSVKASFTLGITPAQEDLNQSIFLTKPLQFIAEDTQAQFPISLSLPRLNTNIAGDEKYEGLGKVVE